jgi:hypothetical protein
MEGGIMNGPTDARLPANCETCHKDRTYNQALTFTIN